MRRVIVRVAAADFAREMGAMRRWIDSNQYEPTRFKYDQDEDAVVIAIDFPTDAAAQAFASGFVGGPATQASAPLIGGSSRRSAK